MEEQNTYVSEYAKQTKEGRGFLTGYFRDGKRRIDLVLVTKDTADEAIEQIKMDFLLNATNMGLDLEIEAGFDETLTDLIFIKVHAHDRMLRWFSFYYKMNKFFKKAQIEFIKPCIRREKELIKTIRLWYPGPGSCSPTERSTLVYRALLSCPFGTPSNYVGLNQLIDKKIVLDAYPLHDGPFSLTEGQTPLELNGRQALYYSWCTLSNLFTRNPVHLIREYFGERIGFLFSFYQMYNWWLSFLAVTGVAFFMSNYFNEHGKVVLNEYGDKNTFSYERVNVTRIVPYEDLPVCPRCWDLVACPFRNMTAYERELRMRVFLTNPYNFLLPLITFIWGILFYILWKRKEFYLSWLWECVDEGAKSFVRPTSRIPNIQKGSSEKSPAVSKCTRMRTCLRESVRGGALRWAGLDAARLLLMVLVLAVIFLVYFPLMVTVDNKLLNRLRYVEDWLGVSAGVEQIGHAAVDTLGAVHAVLIIAMEYLWYRVSRWMVKTFPKPRSAWWHESFYAFDLFGVSLLINFTMLLYYGFLKGALYSVPHDEDNWELPLGLGVAHCGLLTCVDEVFILFVATYKTKTCIEDLYRLLEKQPVDVWPIERPPQLPWCWQGAWAEPPLPPPPPPRPCWEREYFLRPVDDTYFWKELNRILLQAAVVTSFACCFPLGPLLAFLWNIWHQNYMAGMLVTRCRRPLVTYTWGLGAWKCVVLALPYLACALNLLFMTKHNTIMHILFNKKYWSHHDKRRFLADYYMGFFNFSRIQPDGSASLDGWHQHRQEDNGSVPDFCMFPGHRIEMNGSGGVYWPMAGYHYALWHQVLLFILYMTMVIVVGFILLFAISTRPRALRELLLTEAALRRSRVMRLPPPRPPARLPRLPPAPRSPRSPRSPHRPRSPRTRSPRPRSPRPSAGDAPRSPLRYRPPRRALSKAAGDAN